MVKTELVDTCAHRTSWHLCLYIYIYIYIYVYIYTHTGIEFWETVPVYQIDTIQSYQICKVYTFLVERFLIFKISLMDLGLFRFSVSFSVSFGKLIFF